MNTSQLYDPNKGLSNLEIKSYFNKYNIPYHEVDKMEDLATPRLKQSLVYTGSKPDSVNKGTTKHWLAYTPFNNTKKTLFDSYGDPNAYNKEFLDKNRIHFVNNRQLQAYDTNVCGEYCAAWAKFIHDHPEKATINPDELIEQFIQQHNLTKNRVQNDQNIRKFYEQTK